MSNILLVQSDSMESDYPSCCKRCCFYHGANGIVCAIHPYGPTSEACGDFALPVSSLDNAETVNHCSGIRQLCYRHNWIMTLIISLLFSFGIFRFMVWRVRTYSLTAPTTKAQLSIGKNPNRSPLTSNGTKTDFKKIE